MLFIRTIVDVNPVPGGPPIPVGVYSRMRLIEGGSVVERWSTPWPAEQDLPAELLVCERYRNGVVEHFDPAIRESKLPP